MISGKNIFITGGAGFIGAAIAARLADQNQVVLFDNLHRNALANTALGSHPNIDFQKGDVLNPDDLKKGIVGATHVIHLAAIAGVDAVMESPVRTMRVNLLGTLNLLQAASELKGLERCVDFSTSEVFGTHAYKVEETHVTSQGSVGEARWTYAVSKLAGEYLAHSYHHEFGLPAVTVRPFNIYGPNQVGVGAIHHFVRRALRNETIQIYGDGSQIRAWCYIDDIVDALLLILEKTEAIGQVFNVGNPRSTVTVYELAKRIVQLCKSRSLIEFKPLNYTDVEIRVPSIDKARMVLGFDPKFDLDDGLLLTLAWYRSRQ